MQKKLPSFNDLHTRVDVQLLAIKMEESDRMSCEWQAGLTDSRGIQSLNYFKCQTVEDAHRVLNILITEYGVTQGQNHGVEDQRFFVYVECAG